MCLFQVCYTQGSYIQVRVHSEVFDPLTRQHKTTNVFHFTFVSDRDVPNIIPKTYGGKHTAGYQKKPLTPLKRNICEAETNQVVDEWMKDWAVSLFLIRGHDLTVVFLCLTESMLYLDGKRHLNQTMGHWMQHVTPPTKAFKTLIINMQSLFVLRVNQGCAFFLSSSPSVYKLMTWRPVSVTLVLLF